jgi:hypothetical protein
VPVWRLNTHRLNALDTFAFAFSRIQRSNRFDFGIGVGLLLVQIRIIVIGCTVRRIRIRIRIIHSSDRNDRAHFGGILVAIPRAIRFLLLILQRHIRKQRKQIRNSDENLISGVDDLAHHFVDNPLDQSLGNHQMQRHHAVRVGLGVVEHDVLCDDELQLLVARDRDEVVLHLVLDVRKRPGKKEEKKKKKASVLNETTDLNETILTQSTANEYLDVELLWNVVDISDSLVQSSESKIFNVDLKAPDFLLFLIFGLQNEEIPSIHLFVRSID